MLISHSKIPLKDLHISDMKASNSTANQTAGLLYYNRGLETCSWYYPVWFQLLFKNIFTSHNMQDDPFNILAEFYNRLKFSMSRLDDEDGLIRKKELCSACHLDLIWWKLGEIAWCNENIFSIPQHCRVCHIMHSRTADLILWSKDTFAVWDFLPMLKQSKIPYNTDLV